MDSSQPPLDLSRHLLPEGCKDLIQALPMEKEPAPSVEDVMKYLTNPGKYSAVMHKAGLDQLIFPSPILKQAKLPGRISLRDLAINIGVDPRQLQRALVSRSMSFDLDHELEFGIAALICQWCGVTAVRDDQSICAS